MAVQHGMPGEWAKVRGTVLSLWPLFVAFALFGAFAAALALGRQTALFGGLFTASLVLVAVLWRNGVRRVESFFKGARGEERTAEILSALSDDWHVFHDFQAGAFHVDHVVIGPAGVFSVETKNWQSPVTIEEGEVLVSGRLPSRPPLKQAVQEAKAVQAALAASGWTGEPVPIVSFASNTYAGGRAQAGLVTVINVGELVPWLRARPPRLAPPELARLVQLLETRI